MNVLLTVDSMFPFIHHILSILGNIHVHVIQLWLCLACTWVQMRHKHPTYVKHTVYEGAKIWKVIIAFHLKNRFVTWLKIPVLKTKAVLRHRQNFTDAVLFHPPCRFFFQCEQKLCIHKCHNCHSLSQQRFVLHRLCKNCNYNVPKKAY